MRRLSWGFWREDARRIENPIDSEPIDVSFDVNTESESDDLPLPPDLMDGKPKMASDAIHLLVERYFGRVVSTVG